MDVFSGASLLLLLKTFVRKLDSQAYAKAAQLSYLICTGIWFIRGNRERLLSLQEKEMYLLIELAPGRSLILDIQVKASLQTQMT